MTLVEVANDLLIEAIDYGGGYRVGVVTSQPVTMLGAAIVKVSGVVHDSSTEACLMEIQGSNDLAGWITVHSQALPTAFDMALPKDFESLPAVGLHIEVPFSFVRVRFVLVPTALTPDCPAELPGGAFIRLTAHLNTGLEPV